VNLRKDHCRNLPSRTTRERVFVPNHLRRGPAPRARPRRKTNPRRGTRQGIPRTRLPARRAPFAARAASTGVLFKHTRLSATDISALASMKNVAKCDTWCELQNPVNHRVFERKLRPKPSGRGHVCLGVTHRVAPPPRHRAAAGERMMASRAPARGAAGPNASPRRRTSRRVVVVPSVHIVAPCLVVRGRTTLSSRELSDRDPRSGGTTR
jgi:hypothetical protein